MGRVWLIFPEELRQDQYFRKRLKAYYVYMIVEFVVRISQLNLLYMLFKNIPPALQWMMGFVLPAVREINEKVLAKLIIKASKEDKEDQYTAICLMKIDNYLGITFFIAIQLGATATELTIRLILAVDFVLSLFLYVSLPTC